MALVRLLAAGCSAAPANDQRVLGVGAEVTADARHIAEDVGIVRNAVDETFFPAVSTDMGCCRKAAHAAVTTICSSLNETVCVSGDCHWHEPYEAECRSISKVQSIATVVAILVATCAFTTICFCIYYHADDGRELRTHLAESKGGGSSSRLAPLAR